MPQQRQLALSGAMSSYVFIYPADSLTSVTHKLADFLFKYLKLLSQQCQPWAIYALPTVQTFTRASPIYRKVPCSACTLKTRTVRQHTLAGHCGVVNLRIM